ncbi:MAG: ATP-binding cassette domain-containing protein [Synergistaceae bacterium]|nr:ATP-binding cassette domain-containing protein [Synergistaceae bacterium]
MGKDPIISIRGAVYSYKGAPSPALCGADLEVLPGEWVALLGANGSGKSTLAKICNALLEPTQGDCFSLSMDCRDPACVPLIRQGAALVFQNPDDQIVASIVEEDVAFGPENLGLTSGEIRRRVDRALELTGLSEHRRRGSHSLSGGQKQRLALAGALALEPKVLILDEATSMLDPEGRAALLECLRELNASGMTLIQITHIMEDIARAGRIAVMQSGRIVWDGLPADFWRGEYLRFGFDEPGELALYRELISRKMIPEGTRPIAEDMAEALCL